jgi:hypothetical protein
VLEEGVEEAVLLLPKGHPYRQCLGEHEQAGEQDGSISVNPRRVADLF